MKILGIEPKILNKEISTLKLMGVKLKSGKNYVTVLNSKNIKPTSIKTEPYPGFPTDLQAQIMVLMTKQMEFQKLEKIYFEKKIYACSELIRMGAKIKIFGDTSFVYGLAIEWCGGDGYRFKSICQFSFSRTISKGQNNC